MAEGILKYHLKEKGIDFIEVSSAGTSAMDGAWATPFAIEAAKAWGIDISGHNARFLTGSIIDDADLILAMAAEHVETVFKIRSSAKSKTFMIKAFPESYSPNQEKVSDPIGSDLEQYNQTFMELDELLRRIEGRIINMAQSDGKKTK